MPSGALDALRVALQEITDLGRYQGLAAQPTPALLRRARAVGRARIVLLSSHFERYFYAVNEEAVLFINGANVAAIRLAPRLKLLHSSLPIDDLARMGWDNREQHLMEFLTSDGWLWANALQGTLAHVRLLAWMKSPRPDSLVRYYQYWGINDIFVKVTRTPQNKGRLRFLIAELVDKRNSIAHGEFGAQATHADIQRYMDSVRTFCTRADRVLSRVVGGLVAAPPPW